MRIALVCDQYPPRPHGGIGTFVRTYAQGLAGAGHDVTVVEPARGGPERAHGPVRVVPVPSTRVRGVAWWRDRRRLREHLLDAAHDVVEVPDYRGWLPHGAGGTPVVVRVHGSQSACALIGGPPAGRRERWCEQETLRRAAACIHPSRHALRAMTAAGLRCDAPTALVPHPVPLAPEDADPPGSLVPEGRIVLLVGSLWGFRGVRAAARATRAVMERCRDVHAVFVGEDALVDGRPSFAVVRDEVGEALGSRLHLTGLVPPSEVVRWMRAADVLLHPGEHEAFGLVVLEAMRESLPVVGSARGACSEIVRDGATALTAAPDDPVALAAAVLRLLDDRELAARLVAGAHEDLRARFSLRRCVADSVAAYERAVAAR